MSTNLAGNVDFDHLADATMETLEFPLPPVQG